MPGIFDDLPPPSIARSGGSVFDDLPEIDEPAPADINPDGVNIGGMAAGGALLAGAAALATRNPGALSSLFKTGNAVRQQLMLSGLAVPKSMLGNTGALVNTAIERRTMQPLKELLSGRVFKDAVGSYRAGRTGGPAPGVTLPGPNPGKVMGAMDDATQQALQRSGLTADESAREVLQSPLGENFGKFGDALEGPVAAHIMPFRRTPFNQFVEGLKTVKPDYAHKGVTAGYATAGAMHGTATADERYPVTIPLATALAAKYGLPYALAAVAARKLLGGAEEGGGILGSALPVSEYGVEQSLSDPLKPFTEPAFNRFFK
jgi:hypothetical protein